MSMSSHIFFKGQTYILDVISYLAKTAGGVTSAVTATAVTALNGGSAGARAGARPGSASLSDDTLAGQQGGNDENDRVELHLDLGCGEWGMMRWVVVDAAGGLLVGGVDEESDQHFVPMYSGVHAFICLSNP